MKETYESCNSFKDKKELTVFQATRSLRQAKDRLLHFGRDDFLIYYPLGTNLRFNIDYWFEIDNDNISIYDMGVERNL
jgi:hypothetical protein